MTWQKVRLVKNVLGLVALLWFPTMILLIRQPTINHLVYNLLTTNFYLSEEAARDVIGNFIVYGLLVAGFLWVLVQIWFQSSMDQLFSIPVEEVLKVKVGNVAENSAAHQGGLRSGDEIVKVNDGQLTNAEYLSNWWREDNKIELVVLRNGQELQVTLRKE